MFYEIFGELTHEVNEEKVNELVKDILENGWKGAPVIFFTGGILTGNHRTAALRKIAEMYENEKLTEEQEKRMKDLDSSDDYYYDAEWIMEEKEGIEWDYDSLGNLFEGTELEEWKDEIEEW